MNAVQFYGSTPYSIAKAHGNEMIIAQFLPLPEDDDF